MADRRNDSEKKSMKKRRFWKLAGMLIVLTLFIFMGYGFATADVYAADTTTIDFGSTGTQDTGFELTINTTDSEGLSSSLQIIIVLTVIALAPSILIMVTCFTRIIIVLHFTRAALGTQTAPPNQVMIGIALFLTFFVMSPVFSKVNTAAIEPLSAGAISQEEAFELGVEPIKEFMLNNTDKKDLNTMLEIAGIDALDNPMDYSLSVVIPSFILSELRSAFIMGFMIYIPFIVIDMVVASVLMSMGMMMLPPTTISLPFKILLFVLADGWSLVIVNMLETINM